MLPLIDLFPDANIKIAGLTTTTAPSTNEETEDLTTAATQEEISTTTEEEITTTEGAPTTTTENPADLPKTGDVELLVEDITYWGNMIHWSTNGQYLAIADIWGQRYLRYAEIPEATTTVATTTEVATTVATTVQTTTQAHTSTETSTSQSEDTTQEGEISTESAVVVEGRTNPTTSITTVEADTTTTTTLDSITIPDETTTTEIPTTTAEPLPYTLHSMSVSIETVFMLRPQGRAEGAFPLVMPVFDPATPLNTNKVVMAYSERLHIVEWDLNATEASWLSPEVWLNSQGGRVETSAFMVPSPAWVDPAGRMVVSTHDFR